MEAAFLIGVRILVGMKAMIPGCFCLCTWLGAEGQGQGIPIEYFSEEEAKV